jgi:hypothetical protein
MPSRKRRRLWRRKRTEYSCFSLEKSLVFLKRLYPNTIITKCSKID